jgi:hypothetical protein
MKHMLWVFLVQKAKDSFKCWVAQDRVFARFDFRNALDVRQDFRLVRDCLVTKALIYHRTSPFRCRDFDWISTFEEQQTFKTEKTF